MLIFENYNEDHDLVDDIMNCFCLKQLRKIKFRIKNNLYKDLTLELHTWFFKLLLSKSPLQTSSGDFFMVKTEIFIFWNILKIEFLRVKTHIIKQLEKRNIFSPYTLYERIAKTNYFFLKKKFLFCQSAFNSLILSNLQPKYFRNIFFLNISIFLLKLFLNLHRGLRLAAQ